MAAHARATATRMWTGSPRRADGSLRATGAIGRFFSLCSGHGVEGIAVLALEREGVARGESLQDALRLLLDHVRRFAGGVDKDVGDPVPRDLAGDAQFGADPFEVLLELCGQVDPDRLLQDLLVSPVEPVVVVASPFPQTVQVGPRGLVVEPVLVLAQKGLGRQQGVDLVWRGKRRTGSGCSLVTTGRRRPPGWETPERICLRNAAGGSMYTGIRIVATGDIRGTDCAASESD